MIDAFLFVGLPYIAIVTAFVAGYWRWRTNRFSLSSRSSQFLEDKVLLWGSAPWHIGILLVLLGHIIAGVLPQVWSSLLTVPGAVVVIETIGVASALPFTRLMHLLFVPISYVWRAPQIVIRNTVRRRQHAVAATVRAESRREFIKGAAGLAGATGLIAASVSEKSWLFLKGPQPNPEAEAALIEKKLQRLKLTAEERELELERQRNEMILVARCSELTAAKGKYFIDYKMAPGLAFLGKDGLPLVYKGQITLFSLDVFVALRQELNLADAQASATRRKLFITGADLNRLACADSHFREAAPGPCWSDYPMKFSAVILAGGQSRRMGKDKAFLQRNGQCLLDQQIKTVQELQPVAFWPYKANGADLSYAAYSGPFEFETLPSPSPRPSPSGGGRIVFRVGTIWHF